MKHCETCGWYSEPFWKHNLRHLRANPHAFCRTIRCGRGCPVRSNHAS